MANNLDQQKEMNELLKQQNKLWAAQEKNLKNQTALMVSLVAAMKGISFKEAIDQVKELNDMLSETSDLGTEAGTSTSRAMRSAAEAAEEALDQFEKLNPMMGGFIKNLTKVNVAAMAGQGAMRGFSFSIDMFKNIASGIAGLVSSLFQIGVAILSIPFRMWDAFLGMQTSGSNEWRQALEDVRKAFGDLTKNSAADLLQMEKNLNGVIAQTGLSTYRIFGNRAEQLNALREYATKLGAAFNVLSSSIASSADETERFAAYMKGLGMSDAGIKGVGERAVALGTTVNEIGRQITTFAFQVGEAFGINGRQISADVGEMIGDISHFGNLTVKEMTQAAVFTRKLGLEFKAILGTVEAFDNFDKAAEGAAQLAQAFGMNIDAMQMVREQDPAARFEALRKSFFATGRAAEQMTRQELNLLAAQTGLSAEAVKLGFSAKSQAMSYDQVQKAADGASKKQLTQEEAMQKLANSIDRLVKSGSQLQGGFIQHFLSGFERGIMRSREFREMFWSIRRALRDTYWAGAQVGRMFVQLFPGVKQIFSGIAGIFDRGRFHRFLSDIKQTFFNFFRDIATNPREGVLSFINSLKENFLNWFNGGSEQGSEFLNGLKSFFKAIIAIITELGRYAIQGLIDGIKGLINFIRNPRDLGVGDAAADFVDGTVSIFAPLWDMLLEMLPQLGDALWELFTAGLEWAWNKLQPYWEEYKGWIIGGMIAWFTVPAALGAMAGAIGGFMLKAVGIGLANAATGGAITKATGGFWNAILGVNKAASSTPTAPTTAPTPTKGFIERLGDGAKAIADLNIPWGKATTNALKIGVMIAVGLAFLLAEIALFALAIDHFQISTTSLLLAGLIIAESAAIALAVGYMAKALAQVGNTKGAEKALVNVALFIAALGAIAFIEVAAFIALIQSTGTTPEQVQMIHDLMVTMAGFFLVAGGLALATIILAGPAAGATAGLVPVGSFIGGLGLVMLAITGLMRLVTAGMTAAEVQSLANLISVVSDFMWDSIPLTIAAMALGIAMAGPQALIAGGLLAAGLAAIATTVTAALAAARDIINAARNIEMNAETENKVQTILRIFETLVNFINAFTNLISLARPSDNVDSKAGILTESLTHINNFIGGENGLLTKAKEFLNGVVTIATGIPQGQLGNISAVTSILSSVIEFTSSISDVVKDVRANASWHESTQAEMDEFIRNTNQLLEVIIGDGIAGGNPGIRVIASRILNSMSGVEGPPERIAALAKGFGDILNSVGNFVKTIRDTAKGFENDDSGALTRIREFIRNTATELIGGADGGILGSAVGTLLQKLTDFAQRITLEDIKKIEPIAALVGPLFSSLGDISKAVISLGGTAVRGASGGTAIDPAVITNMGTMFTTIFNSLREFLPTLITNLNTTLRGVDAGSLGAKAKALAPVFALLSTVSDVIHKFYWTARNAGGGMADWSTTGGGGISGGLGTLRALFINNSSNGSFFEILRDIVNGIKDNLTPELLGGVDRINVRSINKLKTIMEAINVIVDAVGTMKSTFLNDAGGVSAAFTGAGVHNMIAPIASVLIALTQDRFRPYGGATEYTLQQLLDNYQAMRTDKLSNAKNMLTNLSSFSSELNSFKSSTESITSLTGADVHKRIAPIASVLIALTQDRFRPGGGSKDYLLKDLLANYQIMDLTKILNARVALENFSRLAEKIESFRSATTSLQTVTGTDIHKSIEPIASVFIALGMDSYGSSTGGDGYKLPDILSNYSTLNTESISNASSVLNSFATLAGNMTEFKNSFDPAMFSDNSWITTFFGAVTTLAGEVARVNNDLINLAAAPVEIAANLQAIGDSLGRDMNYRIETGTINFSINLRVNLKADDVANILIDKEYVTPGAKGTRFVD